MKPKYFLFAGAAVALGLVIHKKPGERQVRIGAIEDPEAARAYLRVTDLPQFRLLHWLVARRSTSGIPYGRALDVGAGSGRLAFQLARLAPNLEVAGIDLSDEMVELAAASARERGLAHRVGFRKGSAEDIPFPDASFDLVVSTLSLHHWTDPVQALREVGRVVKPDGRFMVLDLRRDVAILPWLLLSFVQRCVVPPALRHVGEPIGSVKSSYTPEEAAALAQAAGLRGWRITTGPLWLTIEGE